MKPGKAEQGYIVTSLVRFTTPRIANHESQNRACIVRLMLL